MTIKGLEAKILSLNGKLVDVEVAGQKLTVDKEFLPSESLVGDYVNLYFSDTKNALISEKKYAKAVLEEILNGD